jgi:hypothetical protein
LDNITRAATPSRVVLGTSIRYPGDQDPTSSDLRKQILAVEEEHADELADLLAELHQPRRSSSRRDACSATHQRGAADLVPAMAAEAAQHTPSQVGRLAYQAYPILNSSALLPSFPAANSRLATMP